METPPSWPSLIMTMHTTGNNRTAMKMAETIYPSVKITSISTTRDSAREKVSMATLES